MEQFALMSTALYQTARQLFAQNNISPLEAMLVMEHVTGRFRGECMESVIAGSIPQPEPATETVKTGTAEELMEDFNNTGFHPEEPQTEGE